MGKMQLFRIDELVMDKKYYPRMNVGWQTVASYANAMKIGDKFPPIKVGILDNKKILVDGWHRVGAHKLNKEEFIQGESEKYKNERDLFIDAARLNSRHGRPYSVQERIDVIRRLEKMEVPVFQIESILGIKMDKWEKMKMNRIVFKPSGEEVVLKASLIPSKVSGIPEDIEELQKTMVGVTSQTAFLDQLIHMLDNDFLDLENDKIVERLQLLNEKINSLLVSL